MEGAASCFSSGISDMSLRKGAASGRVCIGLVCGAATALEVGEVDPRREEASFTTGVALSPGPMVPPNCVEGIAVVGLENCEALTRD